MKLRLSKIMKILRIWAYNVFLFFQTVFFPVFKFEEKQKKKTAFCYCLLARVPIDNLKKNKKGRSTFSLSLKRWKMQMLSSKKTKNKAKKGKTGQSRFTIGTKTKKTPNKKWEKIWENWTFGDFILVKFKNQVFCLKSSTKHNEFSRNTTVFDKNTSKS